MNDIQYFYITNLNGDIVGITDADGKLIAKYSYDEWGKTAVIITTDDTEEEKTLANINPIRYRGYYLDSETGYYYLQSRYYDPNICRFINADDIKIAQMAKNIPVGTNIAVYCNNDPINNIDPSGHLSKIDAAIDLVVFIAYYVAPILLKDKKNKYTFEASDIIIDKTGLCIAKIKYYKYKWCKKRFQVVLGTKKDWGNRMNINNNLNMTAINYHSNNINKIMSKMGTSECTTSEIIESTFYSFYIVCYLIDAGIKTAKIKYQYNLLWGKYTGRYANSKAHVVLCRILKGGSLNGWYHFC